jgi:ATP synthase protein I
MNDNPAAQKRKLAAYSTVGLMFPVSIAVGLAIGYYLDRWLNTAPYLLIIFTLYGIVGGFVNLIRATRTSKKNKNDE